MVGRFAVVGDLQWGFAIAKNEFLFPHFVGLRAATLHVEVAANATPHTILMQFFSAQWLQIFCWALMRED